MLQTIVKTFNNSDEINDEAASIEYCKYCSVKDIRILEGDEGLFIAMPSKTLPDGSHRDTAHPINKETRKLFEDLILNEYNKTE